jgi:cobalt-zinc-cadmium efflux system protein
MASNHSHSLNTAHNSDKKRIVQVLAITILFMIVEIMAGLFSKSLALLADAGHMLTDVGALTLGLIAIWFAGKPATAGKTYGYYRTEILAGFINAFLLVIISILIIRNSWLRFNDPTVIEPIPVFITALVGLGVNLLCLRLLGHGEKNQVGRSINLKSAYLEIFSDALASLSVVFSSVIIFIFHWYQADAVMSFLIGLFILVRTWNLLSECTNILMEGTPPHVNLELLRNSILGVPGVLGIHDMHVWTITSGLDAMSAHLSIAKEVDQDQILNMVSEILRERFDLQHTTIQIEQASCQKDACS